MVKRFFGGLKSVWTKGKEGTMRILTKRPAVSFFALLIALFSIIALGHYLRTPKVAQEEVRIEKKETAVFVPLTDTPTLKTSALVKKENVIQITALSPGIVSRIYVTVGKKVAAGQTLLSTTNDYNSGAAAIQKQIAGSNAKLTEELARIDKRIFQLEEKRIRHNPLLSSTEEDLELKRLKKDRATRRTTLSNNPLELSLANLQDAVLKPKSFVAGTVESIRVRPGDFVMSGQVLATIRSNAGASTLEALLSRKTAELFDPTKEATLHIDNETIRLLPTYFSQEETENGLYSVLFTLSETTRKKTTNGEYLSLDLPLRAVTLDALLLPIDAVFQENETSTVLVEENGIAVSKIVTLGNIYGNSVEVTSGLTKDARVILSRSVIAEDEVTVR